LDRNEPQTHPGTFSVVPNMKLNPNLFNVFLEETCGQ